MNFIKAFILPFILSSLAFHSYGQSLIGTWQLGSSQVASGLLESYTFKADKTFEYKPNSDDALQRIRVIGGTYTYKPGASYVTLLVKYTVEVTGGIIDRSTIPTSNNAWSIENGKLQKKPIAKPLFQSLELKFVSPTIVVVEQGDKFYKVK